MPELEIRNFGPIKKADIDTGDFTVFVGPQSSGKTIAAQIYLLRLDLLAIKMEMKNYGYLNKIINPMQFYQLYFTKNSFMTFYRGFTEINYPGAVELSKTTETEFKKGSNIFHRALYVPAQRASILVGGYPLNFESLSPMLPFPVRYFSTFLAELLRESDFGIDIFPNGNIFDSTLRSFVNENLLLGSSFCIEKNEYTQRLEIYSDFGEEKLHFDNLASGLKETLPILLSIQKLLRSKKEITLIVEEPETNLHPDGIKTIFALLMLLVNKGHKVLLTTHSPFILELFQLFKLAAEKYVKNPNNTRISKIIADFLNIKDKKKYTPIKDFLPIGNIKKPKMKNLKVYYFERTPETLTTVKDISNLTDDYAWGGLSSFTAEIAEALMDLQDL